MAGRKRTVRGHSGQLETEGLGIPTSLEEVQFHCLNESLVTSSQH